VLYERPRRALAVLALLLATSIVVITIDFRQRQGGPVDRLQRAAIAVFGPLQQGASAVVRPIGNLVGGIADIGGLRSENRRLRSEVAGLQARERGYQEVLAENERLRGALRMARRCGCRTVGASVVARSGSDFQLSVTIDAGAHQGIARDMAVIDAGGLVGRVTQVTADYATVLLVTDPTSGVAATLGSGKAPGILKGTGEELLQFQPVRAGTAPRLGDTVVTRGYQGGVFPAGLPVGVVVRVDPTGAASLVPRVDVRPYAALGSLDVVAVVVDRPAPPAPGRKGR
jgi:rod shape-determining protein MreC